MAWTLRRSTQVLVNWMPELVAEAGIPQVPVTDRVSEIHVGHGEEFLDDTMVNPTRHECDREVARHRGAAGRHRGVVCVRKTAYVDVTILSGALSRFWTMVAKVLISYGALGIVMTWGR